MNRARAVRLRLLLSVPVALLAVPGGLWGQTPDFLFKTPVAQFSIRGGYAMPRAGSEIFDFAREQLTVGTSDFYAPSLEGELAVRVTPRVDIALKVAHARSSVRSEFRDWVGTDDLPIEQTTDFARTPATLGVKFYLRDRGRSISRFAWIPERWVPYVGAAGGYTWYEFDQRGEFVDFETLDIFGDSFRSDGKAATAQVYGGLDLSLGPRFFATGEARYQWGSVDMERDFVGFDRIDLAGFQASFGIGVRF